MVVSYNALNWLEKCLAAVPAAVGDRLSFEVVVVDNNSEPDVQKFLADGPNGARVVQLEENIGYGRACNLGIVLSTGRTVIMLNPDAVLRPGAVHALVDFLAADPGRGLVGGRTLRPDGALDPSSCWGEPTLWSWFCSAAGLTAAFRRSALLNPEAMPGWQRDTPGEVDIVTGCLLLAARETWSQLGGYDPDYFMYGEDADLCVRARRAGWRLSITPDSVAVHAVGASSPNRGSKQRLLLRGKATYARKQWSPARCRLGLLILAAGVGVRALSERTLRRDDRTARTLWSERRDWSAGWPQASAEHLAGRPGPTSASAFVPEPPVGRPTPAPPP